MSTARLIIRKKKYQGVTSVVSARLPNTMIRDIDKVADETGYNRNEVISICLEFAMNNLVMDEEKGGRK